LDGGVIAEHYIAASMIPSGSLPACGLQDIALAEFAHIVHANEGVDRGVGCAGVFDDLHITATNLVGQGTVEFINHLSGPRRVGMFAAELESGIISADSGKVEVELANGEHG